MTHYLTKQSNGSGTSIVTLPGQSFPRKRGAPVPITPGIIAKPSKAFASAYARIKRSALPGQLFATESLRRISGCYEVSDLTPTNSLPENLQNTEIQQHTHKPHERDPEIHPHR